MTDSMRTPGVYIDEINAFPNSVVEVPSAVPAFIGYTQMARRGNVDLTLTPTRISSMTEFEMLFGGAPETRFTFEVASSGAVSLVPVEATRFLLYWGMRLFLDNGGGPCWIVSIGGFVQSQGKRLADFQKGLETLVKELEPTMLVAPDAVLLDHADWASFGNLCLAQCIEMQSRVTILDVYHGDRPRSFDDEDVISGKIAGIRNKLTAAKLSYGVAYYPWLDTSIVASAEISFLNIEAKSRADLSQYIKDQWASLRPSAQPNAKQSTQLLAPLGDKPPTDETAIRNAHQALLNTSEAYKTVMGDLLKAISVQPPSAAMAGVYTRVDNEFGVFKAPANTSIVSVISPTVAISDSEQEDLNVPVDGKAINAIRTFIGRGVLVWGARTLDANSQDWRYINVRRTLIMLEQSIMAACAAYVFAPNDAGTWVMVRDMIENFLNDQWKAGALAGARPADAYDVSVGLGSTMTSVDILKGYMRVTVRVAVVRPAEFIIITFQQKMQTS